MFIKRSIHESILKHLQKPTKDSKIIIIYGARQVGKTTLIKAIQNDFNGKSEYFNCDLLNVQSAFAYENASVFGNLLKDTGLLILDEAQRIKNIGMSLKILKDTYPELRIIATGSSSFELSNIINEPLTGRKVVYKLFPFSFYEANQGKNYIEKHDSIRHYMRFGFYPGLFRKSEKESFSVLDELTGSYLFKDIMNFQQLRKPEVLSNLLKLIAFQIGSEVSYTELSKKLGIDHATVQNLLYLLEESFIIFRLQALKRNLRNEVVKSRKIYFWDLGIRNSIIQNYNSLDFRNDVGELWENFCVVERLKYKINKRDYFNTYFWRTYNQKEIDYIEESGGRFRAFEFKFATGKKPKIPKDFDQAYDNKDFQIIHKDNFLEELFTN